MNACVTSQSVAANTLLVLKLSREESTNVKVKEQMLVKSPHKASVITHGFIAKSLLFPAIFLHPPVGQIKNMVSDNKRQTYGENVCGIDKRKGLRNA